MQPKQLTFYGENIPALSFLGRYCGHYTEILNKHFMCLLLNEPTSSESLYFLLLTPLT